MRPVRLTMQAFGPYATRQVVDFRKAVDSGLFGLYGDTGSGKSSVFSAMTFALFGEPAKSEQDAQSLRSHHAEAGMATEVEFVFEIGGRRYVVHRLPEQMRPRKRGEGETRDAHAAYVFDATGIALDEIVDGRRGKVIAEKKVRAVDDAIVELLGYGAEQFRQVVLLPQGRFEKFLSAQTKERLAILRDLFDVSLYRTMAAHLKQQASEAEAHVRETRRVCDARLSAEGFESPDALTTGIAEGEVQLAALREAEAGAQGGAEKAQAALMEARKIEDRFLAAGKAQAVLAELREKSADAQELATRIGRAEKALGLVDREGQVAEALRRVRAAVEAHDGAVVHRDQADGGAKDAAALLMVEIDRDGEIDGLRRETDALARHGEALEKSADVRKAVETAAKAERLARRAQEGAQERSAQLRGRLQDETDGLKRARKADGTRQILITELADLKATLVAATRFGKAEELARDGAREMETAADLHAKAVEAKREARRAFDVAESALAETQALHLASKLEDGQPCPVCGSADHPNAATGTIDHAGRDRAFRAARDALHEAEARANAADAARQAKAGILADRQAQLDGLERPADDPATLEAGVMDRENALGRLGPAVDIVAAEAGIAALEAQVQTAGADVAACDKTLGECRTATAVERARLDEMLAAVPEEMRERATLDAAMSRASVALTDRRKARMDAETADATARDAALSARKECEGAEKALADRRDDHRRTSEALHAGLQAADLTEVTFAALKPAFATIEADRKVVEDHRVALGVAGGAVRMADDAIRGQARPALPQIEALRDEARTALTAALEARTEEAQRLTHLTGLRDDLAETLRRLAEAEEASGPLRALAALFGGDNAQKLDLETFAIGAMFDRVLMAANQRLGPMTQHQYRLERDTEGSGRARRGLGAQVFDAHSGRARSTTSLSGGESFIAALALALGLADVVESVNGRVRLDTIFIDEGFGSLDTANGSGTLDRVLNTLRSLTGQNRAIGLISHVEMVQDAIPNGFYIRKTPVGSSIETRGETQ